MRYTKKKNKDYQSLEFRSIITQPTKKNRIINRIFNSPLFCIIIGILLFAKTVLFYYKTFGVHTDVTKTTIIGTVWFLIIIVCFEIILTNRIRIIATLVVDFLISFLMFSDNLYYLYSSSYISVAQIENIKYGTEIMTALPTILKLYHILYYIDIILILILIRKRILHLEKKPKRSIKFLFASTIFKGASAVAGMIVAVYISINYIANGETTEWDKDSQMKESTLFGYHIYDIRNVFNTKADTKYKTYSEMIADYEELKNNYEEEYGETVVDLQGVLEGKNVIIIQLESVQEFVVNLEINGTEVTPNLNKFLSENIEFTNMHMQSYSTTADAEHTVVTSLYPVENGMAFSKYYSNTYDDIFKIFKNANYYTSYMHGNTSTFWNRGNVYGRLSIDNLSLIDQFDDTSELINGYLSDELLYRQAVEKMNDFDEPFMTYMVAASSHTPFYLSGLEDKSKVTVDVGKYKDTAIGNYLEAVNYADYAFGILIEELKEAGLYEDTAIVVFGDHNGLGMYDESLIEFLNEELGEEPADTYVKYLYTRVLCGMRIPGDYNMQITKMVNKLDIKPTLAYLCNIEDGFSLGTNMFGTKDFVCVNNGRIIAEDYYYEDCWRYVSTGEEVDLENIDEETKNRLNKYYEYMLTELNISNSVIINNLLASR